MLHSRNIHVTFLVREDSYWNNVLPAEESAMVNRIIREQGFGLELGANLASIEDDGRGRCAAAVTDDGRRFDSQIVGLTAGVSPNVAVTKNSGIPVGRGVLVDWTLKSEVDGVWAAGDCAELVNDGETRNTIQQVWYTGKMQGEVAGDNIADPDGGPRRYDPGIWFNSAKFLDLEYQTYGQVNFRVPGEQNLYWEHPRGKHAARLVHVDGQLIGLQTMGLRWRHEIAERWLDEKRAVSDVIDGLSQLAFDHELGIRHEPAMARRFREQLA